MVMMHKVLLESNYKYYVVLVFVLLRETPLLSCGPRPPLFLSFFAADNFEMEDIKIESIIIGRVSSPYEATCRQWISESCTTSRNDVIVGTM
jgi:hypothetical protein